MNRRVLAVATGLIIATLLADDGVGAPHTGQQPSTRHRSLPSHLPETDRMSINSLAIVPAVNRAISRVGGDYNKRLSVINAASKGGYNGKEIGELLCVFFLLCILEPDLIYIATAVGALVGASATKIKNEIQEFRDRLASSLKNAAIPPITNDVLAADVYSHVRGLDYTDTKLIGETAPLPENTDRILLVDVKGLQITIEDKYAALEMRVRAALRNVSSGATIRSNLYTYTDRDTLKNWTENDSALVANYIIFARNYFGQEIAADFLQKVEFRHVLRPRDSDSVNGMTRTDWRGTTSTDSPTLAWELVLLGDDPYGPWTLSLDEDNIEYDLQVFDGYRLVYAATRTAEPSHQLGIALEDCRSLRWSVRPYYHFNGKTRVGEWMRYHSDISVEAGNIGTEASEEPAYLKGFPSLKTRCGKS